MDIEKQRVQDIKLSVLSIVAKTTVPPKELLAFATLLSEWILGDNQK